MEKAVAVVGGFNKFAIIYESGLMERVFWENDHCYVIAHDTLAERVDRWLPKESVPQGAQEVAGHRIPTDEDARERPWVMVRDDAACKWRGPYILLAVIEESDFPFVEEHEDFKFCRFATSEEIATVG